jgi:hypothetical protein
MTQQDVKQISIRLLPDGFSYSDRFFPISPGPDFGRHLEEGILNTRIAELECSVHCSVETERFSFSPADIDEPTAEQMYRLTLPELTADEKLISETDNETGVRITYGIDRSLYFFLQRNMPEVSFSHPLMDLHREWSQKSEVKENCMIAGTGSNTLDILVYIGGKLHFANRFEASSAGDRTYHIMNVWNICNLDVLDHKIYLHTTSDELKFNVSHYIKQCES